MCTLHRLRAAIFSFCVPVRAVAVKKFSEKPAFKIALSGFSD
jgi:hypothetical protein